MEYNDRRRDCPSPEATVDATMDCPDYSSDGDSTGSILHNWEQDGAKVRVHLDCDHPQERRRSSKHKRRRSQTAQSANIHRGRRKRHARGDGQRQQTVDEKWDCPSSPGNNRGVYQHVDTHAASISGGSDDWDGHDDIPERYRARPHHGRCDRDCDPDCGARDMRSESRAASPDHTINATSDFWSKIAGL